MGSWNKSNLSHARISVVQDCALSKDYLLVWGCGERQRETQRERELFWLLCLLIFSPPSLVLHFYTVGKELKEGKEGSF